MRSKYDLTVSKVIKTRNKYFVKDENEVRYSVVD